MRLAMVMVVVVGCTAPTDLDRLHDFSAQNEFDCGVHSLQYCVSMTVGQHALSCMNDALASGARASYGIGGLDGDGFEEDLVFFTVDHEVHLFTDHPSGDRYHDSEYAVDRGICTGPFSASTSFCPLATYNGNGSDDTVLGIAGCP